MAEQMATEAEALAYIDAGGSNDEHCPVSIARRLEHLIGLPAMYDEWADPECSICLGSGEAGGTACACTYDLDGPRD